LGEHEHIITGGFRDFVDENQIVSFLGSPFPNLPLQITVSINTPAITTIFVIKPEFIRSSPLHKIRTINQYLKNNSKRAWLSHSIKKSVMMALHQAMLCSSKHYNLYLQTVH
jgi:hypothetical protein